MKLLDDMPCYTTNRPHAHTGMLRNKTSGSSEYIGATRALATCSPQKIMEQTNGDGNEQLDAEGKEISVSRQKLAYHT